MCLSILEVCRLCEGHLKPCRVLWFQLEAQRMVGSFFRSWTRRKVPQGRFLLQTSEEKKGSFRQGSFPPPFTPCLSFIVFSVLKNTKNQQKNTKQHKKVSFLKSWKKRAYRWSRLLCWAEGDKKKVPQGRLFSWFKDLGRTRTGVSLSQFV